VSGSHWFGVRWTLLSAIGLTAGLGIGLAVAGPLEGLVGVMLVTPLMLALAGSVLGASQWLAIGKRRYLGVAWVAATAIALGMGMTLGIVFVETVGQAIGGEPMRLVGADPVRRTVSLLAIGALTGAAVGTAQHVLVGRAVPRAWISRCVIAFGVAMPGGGLVAEVALGGLEGVAGLATFFAVAGLLLGVLTVAPAERIQDSV
jgi:hypothetical protein